MTALTKSGRQDIKSEKRQEKWKPSIAGRWVCAESGSRKSSWPSSCLSSAPSLALYSQSLSLEHLVCHSTASRLCLPPLGTTTPQLPLNSLEVRDSIANLQVGTIYFGKDTLPAKSLEDPGPAQLVYCIEHLGSNVEYRHCGLRDAFRIRSV
ncbi:hypothetical protein DEU56DRAFT_772848 [Suillus clintonianus]|uniref:uncharacterized protein n=1 Tax=Suillus clintonianus TaxID=1904413 RepID=UPI001B881654|nr:uncharacterized protein DEU56DRAFT_772848 [Suillus clintonianus]KAG2154084.1 hypothetical protein DEU56DRAFT_772848 [Suillus clintonianus]